MIAGEPDDGKLSRPVRWEAVRKRTSPTGWHLAARPTLPRTVRDQFLVEVTDTSAADLAERGQSPAAALLELNGLFTAWVESVYHHQVHSETGQSPLQRWNDGWQAAGHGPVMPAAAALTGGRPARTGGRSKTWRRSTPVTGRPASPAPHRPQQPGSWRISRSGRAACASVVPYARPARRGLRPLFFRSDRGFGAGSASPSLTAAWRNSRGFCFSRASSSAICFRAPASSARAWPSAATASASSPRSEATTAASTSYDGGPSSPGTPRPYANAHRALPRHISAPYQPRSITPSRIDLTSYILATSSGLAPDCIILTAASFSSGVDRRPFFAMDQLCHIRPKSVYKLLNFLVYRLLSGRRMEEMSSDLMPYRRPKG